MRIGVLGPIWLPIPPSGYGGSEIVVYNLVEGLVDRGHSVTLFASGGSKTRAELRSVLDRPLLEIKGKFDFSDNSYDLLNASNAFAASEEFDVLHNMLGYQVLPFLPFAKCPVVHTSHSSIKEYDGLVMQFKDANYISISNAQRQLHPQLNYIDTVYHGIDTKKYVPAADATRDYFVFLSRIMPEKGVHLAIEAAKQSHQKLVIAGIVDERDKEYFATQIEPRIDDDQIRFVGSADEARKIELFQQAKAMIFPTQWHEAFGLVLIEAMACGTPVIAWNKGAVPEVITSGETGFVVESTEEMAEAMKNIDAISQERCRQEAEKRFSREAMAQGYERVYQSLQAAGR
ncbi:MAG: glycosyltransferase family 4 protein [Candidatus Andersenbacteria bacterium]